LPATRCRIQRLEDLDWQRYQEVAGFLGWRPRIDAGVFAEVARSRPNAGPNPPRRCTDWNPIEAAEFEAEVAPVAEALGYEYRVGSLAGRSLVHGTGAGAPPVSLPAVLSRLFG
ncbi:MAG TPA: hypothetical protein VKE74_18540, partial [Gemmataceae bacterium]|nr:hypothetical protein [Gemmataceae bacterium]